MGRYTDCMAFIKIHNIESVGYVLLVFALIDNKRLKYKGWIEAFVISYIILNLYPWLPEWIRCAKTINEGETYIDIIKRVFNYLWILILCALIIDYKIKYNEKGL